MSTQNTFRIRRGASALGVSALLFLLIQLIHPALDPALNANPSINPTLAAQVFSSPNFAISDSLYILAFPLFIFGVLTLYTYLANTNTRDERWAFVAMILSLAGAGVFLSFVGIGAFAFPASGQVYLQGKRDAIDVIQAILNGPAILAAISGVLLLALGALAFAVAIWRSGILPKWTAILYAFGFVLFIATPQLPQFMRILDGLLIAIGGGWLAWSIWQQTSFTRGKVT